MFNINIYGSNNIVASGDQVQQTTAITKAGDIQSLIEKLRAANVKEADLKDLERAIDADKTPKKGKIGSHVGSWFGQMIGKAASGAWKVAIETAPTLIMQLLKSYYGWQ